MKELIEENKTFTTTIDGVLYKAHMRSKFWTRDWSTSHYVNLKAYKIVKILWFKIKVVDWCDDYLIGTNAMFEDKIESEYINHVHYYNPTDVLKWVNEAIIKHTNMIWLDADIKRRASEVKHKK
jgi:hypothetical protein